MPRQQPDLASLLADEGGPDFDEPTTWHELEGFRQTALDVVDALHVFQRLAGKAEPAAISPREWARVFRKGAAAHCREEAWKRFRQRLEREGWRPTPSLRVPHAIELPPGSLALAEWILDGLAPPALRALEPLRWHFPGWEDGGDWSIGEQLDLWA